VRDASTKVWSLEGGWMAWSSLASNPTGSRNRSGLDVSCGAQRSKTVAAVVLGHDGSTTREDWARGPSRVSDRVTAAQHATDGVGVWHSLTPHML